MWEPLTTYYQLMMHKYRYLTDDEGRAQGEREGGEQINVEIRIGSMRNDFQELQGKSLYCQNQPISLSPLCRQTETWKTYTMGMVKSIKSEDQALIPLSLNYILFNWSKSKEEQSVSIFLVQIFIKDIYDLFEISDDKLQIRDPVEHRGMFVQDLIMPILTITSNLSYSSTWVFKYRMPSPSKGMNQISSCENLRADGTCRRSTLVSRRFRIYYRNWTKHCSLDMEDQKKTNYEPQNHEESKRVLQRQVRAVIEAIEEGQKVGQQRAHRDRAKETRQQSKKVNSSALGQSKPTTAPSTAF